MWWFYGTRQCINPWNWVGGKSLYVPNSLLLLNHDVSKPMLYLLNRIEKGTKNESYIYNTCTEMSTTTWKITFHKMKVKLTEKSITTMDLCYFTRTTSNPPLMNLLPNAFISPTKSKTEKKGHFQRPRCGGKHSWMFFFTMTKIPWILHTTSREISEGALSSEIKCKKRTKNVNVFFFFLKKIFTKKLNNIPQTGL